MNTQEPALTLHLSLDLLLRVEFPRDLVASATENHPGDEPAPQNRRWDPPYSADR